MQNDQLIGTWKLISFKEKLSDGSAMEPYGDDPIGMAIYLTRIIILLLN